MDYIKLFRNILNWEWWHDINTCRVFIFLLLKANWKDSTWKGIEVKRGSYISSLDKVAADTDLTRDEVRTAIKHLTKTKEITTVTTRKYTVFSVLNYDLYQSNPTEITTQIPIKSPTIPTLIPLREEYKEGKNIKKEVSKDTKKKFVPPSVDDVAAYCRERVNNVNAQAFVDFYVSKDWMIGKNKMKDWKAAVRTWERSESRDKPKAINKFNQFEQNDYDFDSLEKELLSN